MCFSFLYKSLCRFSSKSSHFAQVTSQQHTITLPLKINLRTAQRCCFIGGFMSMNNRITWELGLSDNAEGCISPTTLFFKFLSWTKPVKPWALMQLTPNKDEATFQKLVLLITNLNIKWNADIGCPLFDVLTSQYKRSLSSSTSAQDKSVIQPALIKSFSSKIQLLVKVFANQFGSLRL